LASQLLARKSCAKSLHWARWCCIGLTRHTPIGGGILFGDHIIHEVDLERMTLNWEIEVKVRLRVKQCAPLRVRGAQFVAVAMPLAHTRQVRGAQVPTPVYSQLRTRAAAQGPRGSATAIRLQSALEAMSILELSHDVLAHLLQAGGLHDPLRPRLAPPLSASAKGLRTAMQQIVSDLRAQHEEARALARFWTGNICAWMRACHCLPNGAAAAAARVGQIFNSIIII
jgi:hypothetical protein